MYFRQAWKVWRSRSNARSRSKVHYGPVYAWVDGQCWGEFRRGKEVFGE